MVEYFIVHWIQFFESALNKNRHPCKQ
jgi:hypothetical protein